MTAVPSAMDRHRGVAAPVVVLYGLGFLMSQSLAADNRVREVCLKVCVGTRGWVWTGLVGRPPTWAHAHYEVGLRCADPNVGGGMVLVGMPVMCALAHQQG